VARSTGDDRNMVRVRSVSNASGALDIGVSGVTRLIIAQIMSLPGD
jgi:hypothetical protein